MLNGFEKMGVGGLKVIMRSCEARDNSGHRIFLLQQFKHFGKISKSIFLPEHLLKLHLLSFLICLVSLGLTAYMVKSPPAVQETQVQSLSREDPLEKEAIIYFSILAWRILRTEKHGGLQSTGLRRVGQDWAINIFTFIVYKAQKWFHNLYLYSLILSVIRLYTALLKTTS